MCGGAYAATHAIARTRARLLFVAGLALLIATAWVFPGHPGVHHYYDLAGFMRPLWIQTAIVSLLLGLAGARHAGVALFDNRAAVAVGLASYSVYLLHVPVLELVSRLSWWLPLAHVAPLVRNFAIALPVTIALAVMWYLGFERPFQRSVRSHPTGVAAVIRRAGPIRALIVCAAMLLAFQLGRVNTNGHACAILRRWRSPKRSTA